MKYFRLLLLFTICSYFVNAQELNSINSQNVNNEYSNRMGYIFQHLEKNRVPHGILLEQSIDYIDLSHFSGQNTNNNNWVDIHKYRDIYYTLITGKMISNNILVSPQELSNRHTQARTERTITLTGLFMKYSTFKPNAYQNNLIRIQNEQVYDKYTNGVWQNPYDVNDVFAIAPSVTHYKGKAITVKLPTNLWSILMPYNNFQYPNEGFISSVEQIAERFARLILQISIGVESTIKTSVKSENFLLRVSLIFSM